MKTLTVILKNRKRLESRPAPFVQLIEWRSQLQAQETIQLPTMNGLMRVDGQLVLSVILDQDRFTTEEAAAGMRFEPYTHYASHNAIYQYSLLSQSYERADVRGGIVVWVNDCLPDGEWTRRGRDSFLNAYQISAE